MGEMKQRYEQRLAKDIELLKSRIDVTFDRNPFRSLKKRFIIAASPRTGSTLLAEMLLTHGAIVSESLLPIHVFKAFDERGYNNLGEYCDDYLQRNARHGAFGTKGWPPLLAPLVLSGEFPHYLADWKLIHLTRQDVVKQAISKVIAAETLAWQSRDVAAKTLDDSDFDAGKIHRALKACLLENEQWDEFFGLYSIEPLRVTYEELADNPVAVGARVADFIGLHGPPLATRRSLTPLEVQATDLNTKWEQRYLEIMEEPHFGRSRHEIEADDTPVADTAPFLSESESSEVDHELRIERVTRLELDAREVEARVRIIEARNRLEKLQEEAGRQRSMLGST